MLLLDVLVRYPTVTISLVLAFLCVRYGWQSIQGRLGALTSLSMAALSLATAPAPLQLPSPALEIARIIDTPNLALLWLFALSLFRDHFRMGRIEWAVLLLYSSLIAIFHLRDFGLFQDQTILLLPFGSIVSALMITHLVWTAFSGRRDDLVEARRRGRVAFGLGMSAAAAISIATEFLVYRDNPELVSLVRAAVTLPLLIWAVVWLTELRMERLLFQPVTQREVVPSQIDPKDRRTHQDLITLMENDHLYTEQGLTIRSLAERMRVPEHQLRALINKGMGFRNFSDFLNRYRIDFAKKILSDPDQARLPVLTIAMDAGYNSLAPFNRAFKALEGTTPTQFRSDALGRSGQS